MLEITSYVSIIVQLIVAGICLGIFVLPYMLGRSKAVKAGTVYGVVMTVLYIMPGLAARVWLHYGLYVAVRVLDMLFGFLFLFLLLSVKAANRAYESKGRYMERRELVMLSVPSLSGIRHGSPCDNHYFPEMEDITGGAVRS